jgi:hypothetical protein
MSIIQSDIFNRALLEPLDKGANELYVVSGYATANMAAYHIACAKSRRKNFALNLIVGMCPQDGIEVKNHRAITQLQGKRYSSGFKCRYLFKRPSVHSKVYAWFKDKKPIEGFVGSANYTQNAFKEINREVLTNEDPKSCYDYYKSLLSDTVECNNKNAERLINIFDNLYTKPSPKTGKRPTGVKKYPKAISRESLSLLDKDAQVPKGSGLNWGQRVGRNHNEAYLSVPSPIQNTGFFPPIGEIFTVTTDDDQLLICVRAQANGKAIHTTFNNALLGEYFRKRLGLKKDQPVTKNDLLRYGRSYVDFYKFDDENYLMDFSVA